MLSGGSGGANNFQVIAGRRGDVDGGDFGVQQARFEVVALIMMLRAEFASDALGFCGVTTDDGDELRFFGIAEAGQDSFDGDFAEADDRES